MVFLNGNFIPKNKAFISVMDRGFLFGDGVYEVIPVYNNKIFRLKEHLKRLKKSLNSTNINNPYDDKKWEKILFKLIGFYKDKNCSIYLQITRGTDNERKHSFDNLKPSIYIQSSPMVIKSKEQLKKGFSAISNKDIRWNRCDIKSTSLLANVMYAQLAKNNDAEEVVLYKNNKVTEGATSNVFMLKDNTLFTHPTGEHILAGITRDLVLQSAKNCQINIQSKAFSVNEAYNADELWISSSTREIMPIIKLDNKSINNGKVGGLWPCVYDKYQQLKND